MPCLFQIFRPPCPRDDMNPYITTIFLARAFDPYLIKTMRLVSVKSPASNR
jgi:hypothetical protein